MWREERKYPVKEVKDFGIEKENYMDAGTHYGLKYQAQERHMEVLLTDTKTYSNKKQCLKNVRYSDFI